MPRTLSLLLGLAAALLAQEYRPPADSRPVVARQGAASILPGGRAITPVGRQAITGPGAFGIAASPDGRYVVTANGGPNRYSLSVLEKAKTQWRIVHHVAPRDADGDEDDDDPWRSVFLGLAFYSDREAFASEGNSGRIRLVDVRTGKRRGIIDLNDAQYRDSYTADLAYDRQRKLLFALDQANFRVAVIDAVRRRVITSVRVGRLPFSLALSPDGKRLWVTNLGMFHYQAIPGADPKRALETGLPFPAFGFPSPEAAAGTKRTTGAGAQVDVPGLGDPNVVESNSVCVIDVEDVLRPKVVKFIRVGVPFGQGSLGGSSPSGITLTADRAYVSNGHNDSISVISTSTLELEKEIALRIPGLEQFRGLLPVGSAFHEASGWLLVAEAGINALAVIDTKALEVIGHIPTAWFPARVIVDRDVIHVACAKGYGTGPNGGRIAPKTASFQGELRRGALLVFAIPDVADLPAFTTRVMTNNGFVPRQQKPGELPAAIEHVVIIVKENRTFDEVLGDIDQASNGLVNGVPLMARFGRRGVVTQRRGQLQTRLGLRSVNVTPNHHAMAARFAFSDNFYADAEVSVDGHHWLVGSYPNAWTESSLMAAYGGQKDFRLPTTAPGRLSFAQSNASLHPEEQLEAGALWHHLERHGVTFRNYGAGFELAGVNEGAGSEPTGARFLTNMPMPDPLYRNTSRTYPQFNMNIPDQYRATQFIQEIEEMYVKPGKELPRVLYIHLPNDHIAKVRPEDGYPFEASFVADNDYALGRIVEYLSRSKWWNKMAIFVTEDDAQGGVDHVDSHRTILLAVSPYARKNYVSHVNASFPALLKTVFRLLRIPSLNLYDATAADLSDCFTSEPDFTPYQLEPVNNEVFDPQTARAAATPDTTRMDDPRVLQEQHRRR